MNNDLDTLLSRLGDPSPSTIKALIDAIEAKLDDGTYGLVALQTLLTSIQTIDLTIVGYVDEIEGLLKNATYGLAALKALIDAVEGKLDNATYGLNALKTLINAIEAKLDNATYGLSALNTDLDTLLARLTATRAGYLDNLSGGAVALASVCTQARLAELGATNIPADIDKLLSGIIQGEGTVLPSNKSLYDILWVDRYVDESGLVTWDTSEFGTSEINISQYFTTPLSGLKRRKYMVYLDLAGPVSDGAAWTTCIIKVQTQIDGLNYRTIDKATKTRAGLGASEETGVPIEIPPIALNVRIMMQFDVALQQDRTIYYHVVQEKLEY